MVPVAAGIIIAIGDVQLRFSDSFVLSGIAFGTIVTIVMYHVARAVAPASMRLEDGVDPASGTTITVGSKGLHNLEELGLQQNWGLYGHRVLGRTMEGHLIVEEQPDHDGTNNGDDDRSTAHGVRVRDGHAQVPPEDEERS
jgi:hypothetical protein